MKRLLIYVGVLTILATMVLIPAGGTMAAPSQSVDRSAYGQLYTVDSDESIRTSNLCWKWNKRHKRVWFKLDGNESNTVNISMYWRGNSAPWWSGEFTHGWANGPGDHNYFILLNTRWSVKPNVWFWTCRNPGDFRIDYTRN